MDRCVGGGELKLLRISAAFAGIHSRIYPKRVLSSIEIAYIRDQVAGIRRDWRTTSEAERMLALLKRYVDNETLSDHEYHDIVRICDALASELLGQYRAVAGAQDDDD